MDQELPAEIRVVIKLPDKIHQAKNAGGFVPMNTGEDAQLETVFHDLGALEDKPGQPQPGRAVIPESGGVPLQARGGGYLKHQRHQQILDPRTFPGGDAAGDGFGGFHPEVVQVVRRFSHTGKAMGRSHAAARSGMASPVGSVAIQPCSRASREARLRTR